MLSDEDKIYLAGFFDGDGCVNIATRQSRNHVNVSHYLQVVFSQCDQPFLESWRDKAGMGTVHKNAPLRHPTINQTKDLWHWRLFDRQAESILRMMLPYLYIKKEQAEIAIRFMQTKGTGNPHGTPLGIIRLREQYSQMLKDAKRGGSEDTDTEQVDEYEALVNSQLSLF